ncbi:MAG: UDP-N-acetylmuramoyl-L-alanine--D-glutamate ligase [Pseudomonadota bacterium]
MTNERTNLRGKRILVVGLARSGIAAARFAAARGASVTVTDSASPDTLGAAIASLDGCAKLQLGEHDARVFLEADLIVMSPGVPVLPEVKTARNAGVEVIAEIELAYRFLDPGATLIAITGTNGKSTTTSLTGAICAASGAPTFCGGNLGDPLILAVDTPANARGGYVVAEVAGFQLETCQSFRPRVAIGLNITEDHLDRYGTLEAYAAVKNLVYRWQQPGDHAIANGEDSRVVAGARHGAARFWEFSSLREVETGACLANGGRDIALHIDGKVELYPVSDLVLVGTHNLENAMAAYLASRLAGVEPPSIRAAAAAFRPLPHRMELVGEVDGVRYYDDSKGTNVGAVAAALAGFPRRVVLIAGGRDKGGDYGPMIRALEPCGRAVVLLGEAAPIIAEALQEYRSSLPVVRARDLAEAVAAARTRALPGDAVVLSPACSSYDMFKNFEHRGRAFREAVATMKANA